MYVACLAKRSYQWTNDLGGEMFPLCWEVTGDAVQVSTALFDKYKSSFDDAFS